MRHPTIRHPRLVYAYGQGQTAAQSGLPRESCPYPDRGVPPETPFVLTQRRNAWLAGWTMGAPTTP